MTRKQLVASVKKAQRGDDSAFSMIFQFKWNAVYYIALKMLGNQEDANDAVQDIFMTVYEKVGTLKDPVAFEAWFNQIVINTCRMSMRKRGRMIPVIDIEEMEDTLEEDNEEFLPEECWDNKEIQQSVLNAIELLSPEQKECILMFYYQGRSIEEIAEAVGNKPSAVKVRLHRARNAIRGILTNMQDGEGGIAMSAMAPISILTHILRNEASVQATIAGQNAAWLQFATNAGLPAKVIEAGMASGVPAQTGGVTVEIAGKTLITKIAYIAAASAAASGIFFGVHMLNDFPTPSSIGDESTLFNQDTSPGSADTLLSPQLNSYSPAESEDGLDTRETEPSDEQTVVPAERSVTPVENTPPTPAEASPPADTPAVSQPVESPSPPLAEQKKMPKEELDQWLRWYKQQGDISLRSQFFSFMNQYGIAERRQKDVDGIVEYHFYELQEGGEKLFICEKLSKDGQYGISYKFTDGNDSIPENYFIEQWYDNNH